ncbi:MAG: hypothetical protein LIP16_15755 [Clostridium sp.]|nr:hypothetical protein [Clostridium sp.]
MKKNNELELNVKKSEMHAGNAYQYHCLSVLKYYFVPCTIEETQDELRFIFDITDMRPFEEAKSYRPALKFGLLVQALEAASDNPSCRFPLNPENLYIDVQGRLRILFRDFDGDGGDRNLLTEIQALAGYLFQEKYTYQDYIQGGQALLKRRKKTRYLQNLSSLQEAMDLFRERQTANREKERMELITVPKRRHYIRLLLLFFLAVVSIGMTALFSYQTTAVLKPLRSALRAQRAYMENNLLSVTDALMPVPVENMDVHEKYILASAYIRGQSVDAFDPATKERLVSRLSYNGDENRLDYWIYLGRLQVDDALDVAMRISDNQLLLYGYLQKLEAVSTDANLTGAEKAEQTDSLKNRIKTLADELGIEYKESQAEGDAGK